MIEFKKYKLGDLCNITAGGDAPKTAYSSTRTPEFNIPIFSNGIENEGLYGFTNESKIKSQAVTLSARGTIGVPFRRKEPYYPIVRLISLTSKYDDLDINYLYYALKQFSYAKDGSVQQQLTVPMVSEKIINLPNLPTQKKIADVLFCIDDKIALNNKTNTELENMAKTIYDYWFTQFDFPDKNGHPYKTSGGQMVYNETLKREIPAEWEVKSLSQICELQRGVTYGKDDEMSENDDHVVQILRGNNISNNHIVYDSNTVYVSSDLVAEEQKIKKFDVVITMSRGSKEHVGKSAMFLFDSPHSYGAFCNKLTPINESQFFVENFMHSDFFKTYINHVCIGTGINNLKGEHFDKAYFAYPIDSVLKQFNEIMKPIYEKRSYMEQANEELTKLRDYLLPLLMNGQIEVK